ncbi:hypothetical protein BO79DRAFT_267496 [Aspergillus costaricaensis CBS 115574]|uniref:Uncharacterized protein n=1 Tax=Aspergillus costaricaensis CBS 115574 TaxID=1448317 RepID=A0ACD1IUG9_9EURO|nr:hypothetical protein BO79DRAFT_267496 [Aspergillus costaricaensis CBS 115574]RAK93391.1 hypothetical protein BO79DRAFT_267496 [Aspergillus costaricaensis CBS 115574]
MTESDTVVSVASDPASSNPKKDLKSKEEKIGITSHWIFIIWSWFLLTIPLSSLTAVFLALVFSYRVGHGDSPFENLRVGLATEGSSDAYYVNMNSSILLFVTSWASTLAPMLSGFLITLASFPIARKYLQDIQQGRFERLPTPYQLTLMLKFFDGGTLGATWSWIVYLVSWKKKRQPQTSTLFSAASVALLATLLGALVSLADTWLHLTTTTVSFTRATAATNNTDYSFGLTPQCLKGNNSVAAQEDTGLCSVSMAVTGQFLANATVSLGVLNNVSDFATVYTYDNNGTMYSYLGIPEGTASVTHRDYEAQTYGAATQCEMFSKRCNLTEVTTSLRYNCSSAFAGFIDSTELITGFFTDSSMTTDIEDNETSNYGTENPFYYVIAGVLSTSGGTVPNSTDFVQNESGVYGYVLGCNTTIYDIVYDRVNNSVTRFVPTDSNTSVSNIWQTSIAQTVDWEPSIELEIGAAAFSQTGQEFADKIAQSFSKVILALGADGVESRPALAAQQRETSLVSRVPMAPLFTLVAVNFLYVIVGLIFAGIAIRTARGAVPDVHARLGISGLVADRFEDPGSRKEVHSVDEMFEEYAGHPSRRVAVEPETEDGVYVFKNWDTSRSSSVDVREGSVAVERSRLISGESA